jgi:beta-lactamase superfamily II metal-dependent hydrolase
METLRIRVYNVRFGDAVLISVPDRDDGTTTTRHILVDLGNVLRGREGNGGEDAVFGPVVDDIRKVLDGRPLDLYVMTHEHMDHVQGLLFASEKLQQELDVAHAWLTASSEAGYYEKPGHENARRKKRDLARAFDDAVRYLAAAPDDADALGPFMFNNDSSRTGKCVEFLRKLADKTTYVHREADLDGTHPFREAKLELWAPEEDTSIYYGHFRPVALGVTSGGANGTPMLDVPKPPRGVDSGAFYSLVTRRRRGVYDNLLQIDRAANNSSVVFSLEWRGYRLLFPGDAEHRSWKEMDKRGLLKPVHFLKVSHHGSWNGTPTGELLDKILPLPPPDDRKRYAAISTWENTYNNVPDTETRGELAKRCVVRSVEDARDKLYFDVKFRAKPAG